MRSPNHRFSGHRPATLSCVMTCVMTLLAAGCASTSRSSCFEDHDPLMGTDLQWCGDDAIGSHGDSLRPDTDLMSLTPARAELGGSTHYYVRMRYQGSDWIGIPAGSQISLNLEGRAEPLVLTTLRGSRPEAMRRIEGRYGNARREAADYDADEATIREIAQSGQVTVSLTIGDHQIETRLQAPNLAPFREFVATYMASN